MSKTLRMLVLSIFMLPAFSTEALGCVCGMSFIQYQPCSAYWTANVVFAGTVTEIGPPIPVKGSEGKSFTYNGRVTRFRVLEAFRGVTGDIVETVERGTSCDFHFKQGDSYFVYGARDPHDGKIYAHSCSATKTLDRAAADLEFARGLVRGHATPSLVGVVTRETRAGASSYRSHQPMADVEIIVEGKANTIRTKTDSDGRFSFSRLVPGSYRVTAKTSRDLRNLYGSQTLDIVVNEDRCSGAAFTVTSLSTISGMVVDHAGKPVKMIRVSLIPLDEANRELQPAEGSVEYYSDEKGQYKFDWIAPGNYRVAVNAKSQPASYDPPYPRTYLPGVIDSSQATVITIKEGEAYEAPEFRLPPPLAQRKVEGIVLFPDGSPVPDALINLEFTERAWFETLSADSQGRFSLTVFPEYSYRVSAEVRTEIDGKWTAKHSAPVEISAMEDTGHLKLIINRQGFYRSTRPGQKREPHR